MTIPLISVITICYNAELTLEATIQSVINQGVECIEHIVIDGGSKDGTLAIIKKYSQYINKFISEPDSGIYDAMNKGLGLASGMYVNFLNSGDLFTPRALSMVANVARKASPDVIYGNYYIYDHSIEREIIDCSLDDRKLTRDYTVCHQTLFASRYIVGKYDTRYRIKSDYLWTLALLKKTTQARIHKIDEPLVRYLRNGFSDQNVWENTKELVMVQYESFGLFQVVRNFPIYVYRIMRSLRRYYFN